MSRSNRPLHSSLSIRSPASSALREDDGSGDDDYQDDDVRKFAESSLERMLSEEAGHFGSFPGGAPHPDSIAAMMSAEAQGNVLGVGSAEDEGDETEDWTSGEEVVPVLDDAGYANADADGRRRRRRARPEEPVQKRSIADLLRKFDPQNPPSGPNACLHDVQMWMECEAHREQLERYQKVIEETCARNDHVSLTPIQRQMLRWYPALREKIEAEQKDFLKGMKRGTTRLGRARKKSAKDGETKPSSETWESPEPETENATQRKRTKEALLASRAGINSYGPFLCALQPEKLAIIAGHETMSLGLSGGGEVKTTALILAIGEAVEAEVHVQRVLREQMARRAAERAEAVELDGDGNGKGQARSSFEERDAAAAAAAVAEEEEQSLPDALSTWTYTPAHLRSFVEELSRGKGTQLRDKIRIGKAKKRALRLLSDPQPWHVDDRARVGAALLQMLMEVATVDEGGGGRGGHQAGGMKHSFGTAPAFRVERRVGREFFELDRPKKGKGKCRHGRPAKGGPSYVVLHDRLNRMATEDVTARHHLADGHTERHRPMVVPPRDWETPRDGGYAALRVDLMRGWATCREQADALRGADLSALYGGLNSLGRVPWRINGKVLKVAQRCWAEDVPLGDVPSRTDLDVPEMPAQPEAPKAADGTEKDREDLTDEEEAAYREAWRAYYVDASRHRRSRQRNMDLNSLRCSVTLKLNQAEMFRDFDEIFFPYNVDFRGRAYPVPPHLSNVGSDLCRGLLAFAEAKPLGKKGFFWLRVHLANLAGADKMSFEDRAAFTDSHMDDVRAAVTDPFGPNRWWMTLDDPFQGLATCHEICAAIDSGDPPSYECSLPVHMDGSCNGLQHYAALGRDRGGGKAVNLCVSDTPQDVYVGVMKEVIRRVEDEAARDAPSFPDVEDPSELTKKQRDQISANVGAKLVNGLIDRGVVKRTVMTSVYGVTFIGAKNQIREKIEEKLEERGADIDEMESEIHAACNYLARLTMDVMGDLFVGARSTMNWLAECARLISAEGQPVAWITPVGIPAIQPYRQKKGYVVTTLVQQVTLTNNSDDLPIHRPRQVSAFPPNFVHSLDSSHMILTALEMDRRGLTFSAVHDSFWTHACDVDEMNIVLRDAFVELHGRPLLEELKMTWELRYPGLTFPDVPETGDLDLIEVRDATYFFQ